MKLPRLSFTLPRLTIRRKFSKRQIARATVPVVALALIASVVTGRERPSAPATVEPAQRIDTKIAPRADDAADIDVGRIQRSHLATANSSVDPFKQETFAAEPASGAGTSAPNPVAPPLPFVYVGKMIDEGKLSIFVARGDDSFTLHKGQKIDDYRVDKVTESSVVFTYLPLKQKQELNIPAVN